MHPCFQDVQQRTIGNAVRRNRPMIAAKNQYNLNRLTALAWRT